MSGDELVKIKAKMPSLLAGVDSAIARVRAFQVQSASDYEQVGEWLKKAKERQKAIGFMRDGVVKRLFRAYQDAAAEFKPATDKYDALVRLLNSKMNEYDRRLQQEAQERERRIREQQLQEENERRAKAEQEASQAETRGDLELAAEIRELAKVEPAPVVVMQRKPPPVDGLTTVRRWKAVVENVDLVPDEYVTREPKMAVLNALARTNQGKNPPPGIRFIEETTRAAK